MQILKFRFLFKIVFVVTAFAVVPNAYAGVSDLLAPVSNKPEAISRSFSENAHIKPELNQRNVLRADELLFHLTSLITDKFQLSGKLQVYLERGWGDLALASKVWDLEIVDTIPRKMDSRMLVHFRLKSQGEVVGEWKLGVLCELWQEVYAANKPINRDDAFSSELLKTVTVDALKQSHSLVTVDEEIAGYESIQTVSEGNLIKWRHVRKTPVVRVGQLVEVLAQEGIMTISAQGIAMQSGTDGEFIKIRNTRSKKEFQAKVVDGKTVKVYF